MTSHLTPLIPDVKENRKGNGLCRCSFMETIATSPPPPPPPSSSSSSSSWKSNPSDSSLISLWFQYSSLIAVKFVRLVSLLLIWTTLGAIHLFISNWIYCASMSCDIHVIVFAFCDLNVGLLMVCSLFNFNEWLVNSDESCSVSHWFQALRILFKADLTCFEFCDYFVVVLIALFHYSLAWAIQSIR